MSKELVIARYAEDLSWISRVPPEYELTIVNKGAPLTINLPPRSRIMTMPNTPHGRESESYARFSVNAMIRWQIILSLPKVILSLILRGL